LFAKSIDPKGATVFWHY